MAKTALVVDDSTSMRQMVTFTLQSAGFETIEGANGVEALAKSDSQAIDIVITDLNMPEMDGISLIKELRAKPAFQYTPILLLTTESQDAKKQEGKAAGATGWMVKPFNPDQLMAIVKKVGSLVAVSANLNSNGEHTMQIDMGQFRAAFYVEAAEHLQHMEAALLQLENAPRDTELLNTIFRGAHSIKGASTTFGIDEVGRFTHVLENLLERLRDGIVDTTSELIELLLTSVDIIDGLVANARMELRCQRIWSKCSTNCAVSTGKQETTRRPNRKPKPLLLSSSAMLIE